MKRWMLVLLLCMSLVCGFACAEEDDWGEAGEYERVVLPSPLTVNLPAGWGSVEVRASEIDGQIWLLLPAFADVDALSPVWNGQPVSWKNVVREGDVWHGEILYGNEEIEVSIMRSQNLRSLFLLSTDPENQGRQYLDESVDHQTWTTASMALVDPEGKVNDAGNIRKIRGRGNFTWFLDKKAYQFKLEDRADLLQTGLREEQERTWILLADSFDGTQLHNRITLDLALEMGLENTSRCEHVDLYYDGEYRGLYLLTEKVEAGEGRLGVDEYDKLINAWNKTVGQYDLEALPVAKAQNRFGNEFTYIDGLMEAGTPDVGSFVLEMEHEKNTLSDRCWLRMSDGSVLACQSPENASAKMMQYVSERLEEARRTLQNGGVNPENGHTIYDDFNVEAFARHLLMAELSYNADTYRYASTWFILPAGQTRFEPGTAWDFDLAYRFRRNGENQHGVGLRDQGEKSWMQDFYGCPDFVQEMQRVYEQELYPLISQVLLGSREGRYLKSLDAYLDEIGPSRRMNAMLWDWVEYEIYEYGDTLEEEDALLRQFLSERSQWLRDALANARPDADRIDLWCYAGYLMVESDLAIESCPWNHVEIRSCEWEQLTEADEETYAVWELSAIIAPKAGYAFDNPTVVFNGTEIACEKQEDGALRICVQFEDPSYRPVDYYGDDIGTVFDPEYYAARYPEIAAEYADDPEGLVEYFCDEGMMEGHRGNIFFEPEEILYYNAELMGVLGTDWFLYYWDFIDFGIEEGWLVNGGRGFMPQVWDALE